jgi:imidazoleglycerol-phosphate dehydratase
MRKCDLSRATNETDIYLSLDLDGDKCGEISTPIGFLNHMFELFKNHSGFDLNIIAKGDVDVDYHHTAEDIGILLGEVFNKCLGEKKGIRRYSDIILPMDEALILAAVDISGRSYFVYDVEFSSNQIGNFDTELIEEFLRAFVTNAKITLHIKQLSGSNAHHVAEAIFKSLAYVLRNAVSLDKKNINDIPSTKGML